MYRFEAYEEGMVMQVLCFRVCVYDLDCTSRLDRYVDEFDGRESFYLS